MGDAHQRRRLELADPGRAAATGFTLLYLVLVVGEGPGGAEGIGFLVLLGLVTAAVAVAWWSATMGVLALVTVGGALALFSAVAADQSVLGLFEPGTHGSTFGGNPLSCSAAVAVIEIIKEENYLEKAAIQGKYFMKKLAVFLRLLFHFLQNKL